MEHNRHFSPPLLILSAFLLCLGITASPAFAVDGTCPGTTYNHSTLYNASKCGANAVTDAITDIERKAAPKPTWSGQGGSVKARVAIDLRTATTAAANLTKTCRWVDPSASNTGTNAKDIFVPFKTDTEWFAFVDHPPTQLVSLAHCARPGTAYIPANDPANVTDVNAKCYINTGSTLLAATQPFTVSSYGREAEQRTVTPPGVMKFTCYTAGGKGPWDKTVTSTKLYGYSADRATGSSINPSNNDWGLISVSYSANGYCGTAVSNGANYISPPPVGDLCSVGTPTPVSGSIPWAWSCQGHNGGAIKACQVPPVNGVCGSSFNGQSLSSAPSGAGLCNSGIPSGVGGSGPWSWSCSGYNGGGNANCSANFSNPSCPVITVQGIGEPINNGFVNLNFSNIGTVRVNSSSGPGNPSWYFGGACGNFPLPNSQKDKFVWCIATVYLRNNVSGYGSVGNGGNFGGWCSVGGFYISPLKVNLAGGDAVMNSTKPTPFYLTLKDKRIMEGHATGGLNADEGWLMVRRTNGPLVFKNGALNGDNWFGDRDGRSLNGYTDLAETFKKFIVKDEFGDRYIPLHVLTENERTVTPVPPAKGGNRFSNPSFDLRVIDASNAEHFASDYFSRIYVNYRNVTEGDGPEGKIVNNVILERGIVRTVKGENHVAIDQWFVLDLPANLGSVDPKIKTKSKILLPQDKSLQNIR